MGGGLAIFSTKVSFFVNYKFMDFDGYRISKNGLIFKRNGAKVSISKQSRGYLQCRINGKKMYVHRLVALSFIDNPDRLPIVNHINGKKEDNRVDNLEWCSYSRNASHSAELNGGGYPIRPVIAKMIASGEIIKFKSMSEAARKLRIDKTQIHSVCNGNQLHTHGYEFKYC